MVTFFGIKFRNSTKLHYAHPQGQLHYGDRVIAESSRGIDCGTVVLTPMTLPDEQAPSPIREMIRLADAADIEKEENNIRREREAYRVCKEKIIQRGLGMKLIRAECPFDDSRILFYFTADGRIDFRELVKDLAGIFRTRIELRQVGVRDETKLLGGMGICGRPLCCHAYLNEFAPVSIKMAKEQNLSLNPTKISGNCGRLMCCLKNESDTYTYLSKGLPTKGNQMTAPDGAEGEVVSVDILRQRVRCVVDVGNDERESREYEVSEISFDPHSKRSNKANALKKKAGSEEGEADGKALAPDEPVEEAPGLSLEEEFLAVSGDIATPLRDTSKEKPANARQKKSDRSQANARMSGGNEKYVVDRPRTGGSKGFSEEKANAGRQEKGGRPFTSGSKSDGAKRKNSGKPKGQKVKEPRQKPNYFDMMDEGYEEKERRYKPKKGR
ncbi:MAG: PSP1 domain-containing protein [bacterium]